jgi:hypothetical protein
VANASLAVGSTRRPLTSSTLWPGIAIDCARDHVVTTSTHTVSRRVIKHTTTRTAMLSSSFSSVSLRGKRASDTATDGKSCQLR